MEHGLQHKRRNTHSVVLTLLLLLLPLLPLVVSLRTTGLALFLFTSLEALPIFMEERSIYTREHSRGAYRVLSYSLANFLIYVPVCIMMAVVFTAISYFMVRKRVLCPVTRASGIIYLLFRSSAGRRFFAALWGACSDDVLLLG